MKLLAELIVRAFVLILATYIVPGFKIDSFLTALILAVVLAILTMILKPILTILTLPATILTLGLFTFVINAFILYLSSRLVSGVHLESFWAAIVTSIVISLLSSLLNTLLKNQ